MDPEVNEALNIIESAQLSPTEHLILSEFINGAVDANHAARFVLQQIHNSHGMSVDQALKCLKRSIMILVSKLTRNVLVPQKSQTLVLCRDGPNCSMQKASNKPVIQRPEPVYIIPPTIFGDSDMSPGEPIFAVMEAFMTLSKLNKLRNLLEAEDGNSRLKNLWILSPSIHSAFRNGHINVHPFTIKGRWTDESEVENTNATEAKYWTGRLGPEEYMDVTFSDGTHLKNSINIFTLQTSNPENYCLPSPFLLRMHHRFSTLLHLFYVEEKAAESWPQPPLISLNRTLQKAIRTLWHLVPKRIRIAAYRNLSKGATGRTSSTLVKKLPFGLYLKQCRYPDGNEENALKTIETHTSIPAPMLVDSFQDEARNTLLVMTGFRGQPLERVFHRMSYVELHQLETDIKRYITQLRSIPNRTPYRFANTVGGPATDHRLPDGKCGPFNAEADFNNHLEHKSVSPVTRDGIASAHARHHQSFFTHADLHPSNILVDQGRLSAILDWECAGFFPEYWEYTKAMYGVWRDRPMERMWRRALDHGYETELRAEQLLWGETPVGI